MKWNKEVEENFEIEFKTNLEKDIIKLKTENSPPKSIFKSINSLNFTNFAGDITNEEYISSLTLLKEIAKKSGSLALSYHINLMSLFIIATYLKDSNYSKALIESIKSGQLVTAFALTEPNHGSDIGKLDSELNQDFLFNGIKKYVVNGESADLFIIVGQHNDKHTIFMCDRKSNDQKIRTKRLESLGVKNCGLSEVNFENIYINENHILSNSFKDVLNIINFDRIGSSVAAIGMAESAIQKSVKYIKKRNQFGKAISEFQAIKFKVAKMYSHLQIMKLLVENSIDQFIVDELDPIQLSICKIECAKKLEEISSIAIDIMGGSGYLVDCEVEEIYRDAKSIAIGGGTKEVLTELIGNKALKIIN